MLPQRDDVADQIQSCVQHYLSRVARPEEVRNWSRHFQDGGDYYQMLAVVLKSDEYFQRADSDPPTLIVRFYTDVLRREPSDQEVRTWLKRWNDVRDRGQLMQDMLDASQTEMRMRGLSY